MKRKKKKSKIYKLINNLMFLVTLIFIFLLLCLDILPILIFIIILFIIIIIELIMSFFLLHPRVKNSIKKKSLIFSLFIIFIITIINIFLIKTLIFINDITSFNKEIINYSIMVKNDNNYTSIKDLKDKKMGYYNLNNLPSDSIEVSVDYDSYNDPLKMYDDLLNNHIDSILLEDSIKSMIEEENPDLILQVKVLKKFSVYEEEETEVKGVDVLKDSFNIYISGIDIYGNIASVSRSDVNIIATINPKTRTILLTSIPRDYYVELYGKNGEKDKLTHAGIYGIDTSIKTLEKLLDIKINYYAKVNFTSVIDIVNILGGIEIESENEFISFDGYHFDKGINYLDGEKALSFARERHSFVDGDRQRNKNQQIILKSLIDKATSKIIVTKYTEILSSIGTKLKTNMKEKEIMSLIKNQIKNSPKWIVLSYNLDGDNGYEYTYSYKNQKLYVMLPNNNSISEAKIKIGDVINGN